VSCHDALLRWEDIARPLRDADGCLLLLDYDGTLSPIVDDPAAAAMPLETKDLLRELQGLPGARVAIISGRSLADLRSRVGLDLIYAGNHGLEIDGPGIHFVDERAVALAERMSALCDDLSAIVDEIPGAILERKGLSASVHFRRVHPPDEFRLAREVLRKAADYSNEIDILLGKKVLELRPRVTSNKGTAGRRILNAVGTRSSILPICIGDDRTDEDLFRHFPDGVTIVVGESDESAARYCLPGVPDVLEVLRRICIAWSERLVS
jgi:trehalose 6-phosphate phosphatase